MPRLVTEREETRLRLRWKTPDAYPLALPVEVAVDGEVRRVSMRAGQGELVVPPEAKVVVDPRGWILREE